MGKHIFQLRRGWKNDAVGRNDWAEYEGKENHKLPLAGELVLEYDNGVPRLKIGDGIHEFSKLPYMSVDSFILPKPTTITLLGGSDHWAEEYDEYNNLIGYTQVVQVRNYVITPNSKVDIQPSPEMLAIFHEKDVTFTAVTETINGITTVTIHAVGQMPQNTYENIQVTVTEVVGNA
jgi:hypothetical protein